GFHSVLTGDASIRRRPMDRVADPLRRMGARISGRQGGRLAPLAIAGGGLRGIAYRSPVASAQVKSAVLLAGLFAEGETSVAEPSQSRDHTERMLGAFGVEVAREGLTTRLRGPAAPSATEVRVPGDLSSAAFLLVAAALVPGSELAVTDVGLNPTRTGVLDILGMMGATLDVRDRREEGGEPVGTVAIRAGRLRGAVIGGPLIPRAIDELPVLAVAASLAEGETVIRDAAELRVKESDRVDALARELGRLGAVVEARPDGLVIRGGRRLSGGRVSSGGDHRIAMALAVAAIPTWLSNVLVVRRGGAGRAPGVMGVTLAALAVGTVAGALLLGSLNPRFLSGLVGAVAVLYVLTTALKLTLKIPATGVRLA